MHHHRAEHWIVVSGTAEVTNGDAVTMLTENQSTYIPLGQTHRLANPGKLPLEIIEVQSGSYLGEDDIVRLDDSYGARDGCERTTRSSSPAIGAWSALRSCEACARADTRTSSFARARARPARAAAVRDFMRSERPAYIFIAAARVGGIHANDTWRADFLYENLMIESNLIRSAHDAGRRSVDVPRLELHLSARLARSRSRKSTFSPGPSRRPTSPMPSPRSPA
jgi:hypothetical protein